MRLNQNSIRHVRGMIRRDQEHQRFVFVRIMLNLSNLRMRGRNGLIVFEIVMADSLPLWNLTLTELGCSGSGSIPTFND